MRPTPTAPNWSETSRDTVIGWFPNAAIQCRTCQRPNGTTIVYGRFTRPPGSFLPRVCTEAYCVDHLPADWYSDVTDGPDRSVHSSADLPPDEWALLIPRRGRAVS